MSKERTQLPAFSTDGYLPTGIWDCNGTEFINRFCKGQYRAGLQKAVQDVFDFASSRGAKHILVGGSFVTRKDEPTDFDCVIVFDETAQIPDFEDKLQVEGTRLDIFYASKEDAKLIGSFKRLFTENKRGKSVGCVNVDLLGGDGGPLWQIVQEPDDDTYEIIKRVYLNRHVVDLRSNKALVTVHGIRSHGEWNAEVCHIASSRGWIVAPFVYGYVEIDTLAREKKQNELLDAYRNHVYNIQERYNANVSVISHSFGTVLALRYLAGFDVPPVVFDTIILTGAIVSAKLDLSSFRGKVARIINTVAPNDTVVDWAKLPSLGKDPFLGNAGKTGFESKDPLLQQMNGDIFDHSNVIRRDVVAQRWMPWLEATIGLGKQEANKVTSKRYNGRIVNS